MSEQQAPGAILLARHGETNDNLEPIRVQGFRDTPLNDTGRRQAVALAERVSDLGVASIVASDLSRARETAEIVGRHIGVEVRLDARLREAHRGRWEGYTFVDIARTDPAGYAAWLRAGADFRFPGGESLLEQQERVAATVKDARATAQLPSLLVCHGGSIRVMLCLSDPRGLAAFHTFSVPNTAVVPL